MRKKRKKPKGRGILRTCWKCKKLYALQDHHYLARTHEGLNPFVISGLCQECHLEADKIALQKGLRPIDYFEQTYDWLNGEGKARRHYGK